ncbi:acyl transferase domain-containing protein/acyl carrier protein [Agrobacterium vitis]|nr:acyl transferase domain-containing protein/acyl carrier protein [Agrobacterium vitis]MBE1436644.1 acyl transferase domain-containing protein/acyl carrier protein [Agrobacterium vitis]
MVPVAIVGCQGRFPGDAGSPAEFFEQLLARQSFVSPVPADRWSGARFVSADRSAGKTTTVSGYFLNYDYCGFDPNVFGFAPGEIAFIDPQQRLVLEVAWEALELAAINPRSLAGQDVGVYVGGFTTDHLLNQFSSQGRSTIGRFSAAGSTLTMLANRLSYALDLRGPSITVDSACASSLSALAIAVRDLQAGACCMALVGGVSFMLRPEYSIGMAAAGLLAMDGRSKPFSHLADGYGRGEGCGMVVLKPLAAAQADGDRIWAVIEAVGTGHGGRTAGISLPNGQAQEHLMRQVLSKANLRADDIGYVEAHGTGTYRGDEIEARSIGAVYGSNERSASLPIGSLKANIGHLEAAAGIASLIKAVMILQSKRIPPHVLLGHPNPDIPFDALGLKLAGEAELPGSKRVAVNAFGYGGANLHVVLGPAPLAACPNGKETISERSIMVPLSAQSVEALEDWVMRLSVRVETGVSPGDLAYTLSQRAGHSNHRSALWVEQNADALTLAAQLRSTAQAVDGQAVSAPVEQGAKTLFVFSGMGPQWQGMGQLLWETEPPFRRAVDEIDAFFQPRAGISLFDAMIKNDMPQTAWTGKFALIASFTLQIGLVRMLADYGVTPDICLGHSAGEIAAAHVAGHLTLEQAVALCCIRSDLQDRLSGRGGMIAARLSRVMALDLIQHLPGIEIAAFNGPDAVTLTGLTSDLAAAEIALRNRHVAFQRLNANIAYHSADMDLLRDELTANLAGLSPSVPTVSILSSVTARRVTGYGDDTMNAHYWWNNMRQPVRFEEAIEAAFGLGAGHCLEVGAKPVLLGAMRDLARQQARQMSVISVLDGKNNDRAAFRNALSQFYETGGNIDWRRMIPEGGLADLPVTGWKRQRFWHEAGVQAQDRLSVPSEDVWAEMSSIPHRWIVDLNRADFAFLSDHRLEGAAVLPGTAALEAALHAAHAARHDGGAGFPIRLSAVRFRKPFLLERQKGQILDTRHLDGQMETYGYDPAEPGMPAPILTARLAEPDARPDVQSIADLAMRAPHRLDMDHHTARLAAMGLAHGRSFQVIQLMTLASDGNFLLAQLSLNHSLIHATAGPHSVCLLDGVFQAALALTTSCELLVPVAIGSYTVYAPLPSSVWVAVSFRGREGQEFHFDATLYDTAGQCLVQLEDIAVKSLKPRLALADHAPQALVMQWKATETQRESLTARRIRIIDHEQQHGDRLRDALLRYGAVEGSMERADASVILVERQSGFLAEQLASLVAICSDLSGGRIYLVTRNAHVVSSDDCDLHLDQAIVCGLARVLNNEMPETNVTLIDVVETGDWHDVVAREIVSGNGSSEVVFRHGQRLVPRLSPLPLVREQSPEPMFQRSSTYLITGGLGGFGQQLALWLASLGAGHILITSRHQPSAALVGPLARDLSELGARLTVKALDVTDRAAVHTLFEDTRATGCPIAGIFHWAGMILDGPAGDMSVEDFRRVLAPKVDGAIALDLASRQLEHLDYFVLASSMTGVIGNPYQANYAAANTCLDALAWSRRKRGLPALSVDFGPISNAGMAADPKVAAHLKAAGLLAMTPETALAGLETALRADQPQVCLYQGVDPGRFSRHVPRCFSGDMFSHLFGRGQTLPDAKPDVLQRVSALPAGVRVRHLAEHLQDLLSDVLKCPAATLSKEKPLAQQGLDSLAGVELQSLVDRDFAITVPITLLIGGQNLLDLGAILLEEIDRSSVQGR